MKITEIKVRITMEEPVLGTASNNPEVHAEYIASKAPVDAQAAEEVAALPPGEEFAKAKTVFHRDAEGHPCLFDYQVRGFLKEACGVLVKCGEISADQCSYTGVKEAIDQRVFVSPRRIRLTPPAGSGITDLTRPLRAQTMQGPRVALATSEQLAAGTTAQFTIKMIEGTPDSGKKKVNRLTRSDVLAALDYGALLGLGQWRSGGWGRFTWGEVKAEG